MIGLADLDHGDGNERQIPGAWCFVFIEGRDPEPRLESIGRLFDSLSISVRGVRKA